MAQGRLVLGVTLDTSVYIGALNSRGEGSALLAMARDGRIRIDISEPILSEMLRVLREKFAWAPYRLQDVRQKLVGVANLVSPPHALDIVREDPADNRVLVRCRSQI